MYIICNRGVGSAPSNVRCCVVFLTAATLWRQRRSRSPPARPPKRPPARPPAAGGLADRPAFVISTFCHSCISGFGLSPGPT